MSKIATKALIDEKITGNGVQAITGPILNNVLNTMVDDYGTQDEVSQLAQEVSDLENVQILLSGGILESAYFTQSSPSIVSYSEGFSVYYYPVKQGDKLKVTASEAQNRAFNYGFTTVVPAVNVAVTNATSISTSSIDLDLNAPADGYFAVAKYRGYFTNIVVALIDGTIDTIRELQGGLPTINIFNISELFPNGGTGGTNVYTEQAARDKVPVEKRKNGLIIAYLTSGGWVIEQSQYTSYDATDWQWSNTAWTPITPAIVNLNSVQRKSDAFADAGTARGYVPRNLRLNPLGLLVTYLLSDGWHLDICISSTFNAGEQYWKSIVSGSSVNIDDGAISTAKLADKAVSMQKLADDVIFKMDYMAGEGKDAPAVASVDLANIAWTYGAYIDSATGQVRSHATQAVSELIPISPLTMARLFAKISGQNTDYRVILIAFYNVSEDGTVTFLQGKNISTNWMSSIKTFMTPSNANAFRLNLNNTAGGVQQAITSADLTDENYSLSASVPDAFSMPKKDIVIPKGIIDLSNADNWQQGDFYSTGAISTTAVWSVRPIVVNEGHKYLIPLMPVFDNNGHMIYQLRVVYMSDLDTILSTSELLWYANAVFTAPKNCKYIHIVAYGHYNQQDLLPSQMPITHLSIVDITEFCGSFKSADKKIVFDSVPTRYGQSIAYYNGYIFHGWSNGDLDVFDEDFNLVASSTLSPATGESGPVHCNVLAFSDDFYEDGDDFPVLWISNNGTSEQKMLGVRIQLAGSVLTLTNVYELPAPAVPDNHRFYTQYFDFHAKHIIVQSYESVSASNLNYCGSTLIEVYSYTDKLTSSSELTKVSSVDVFPRYYPFQGGLVADNHLFATIGTSGTTRMIAAINLTSGVIDSMIYLESELIGLEEQEEVQGFAFFNGVLLVASVHGLYLLTP